MTIDERISFFRNIISEEVSNQLKCSIEKAITIVEQSFLSTFLKETPDYVQHYDTEYWATEIISNYMKGSLTGNADF